MSKLDALPDNKKLTAADFAAYEKMLDEFIFKPRPVTRETANTPTFTKSEEEFMDFMRVASDLKHTTGKAPTVGQVRTEIAKRADEKAKRDEDHKAFMRKLTGLRYP
jgi:hypothetical protein